MHHSTNPIPKEIKKNKSNASNDKSQDENIDKDKLIEDIHNITSGKIDNYIEVIKTDYEKEINELYKVNSIFLYTQ